MMIEISLSFIALFVLFAFIIHYTKRYQEPVGMDYKNTWIIHVQQPWNIPRESRISDSLALIKLNYLKKTLKNEFHEIREISKITTNDIVYIFNSSSNCLDYQKKTICSSLSVTEPDFAKTAGLKMLEGRWIDDSDASNPIYTIAINLKLKKELFGDKNAVGKTIQMGSEKPKSYKIVGVFESLKRDGDFKEEGNMMFFAHTRKNNPYHALLIKLKNPNDKNLEFKLIKYLKSTDKSFKYEVEKLEELRKKYIFSNLTPLILAGSIVIFLVLNVMLGLFGILWLSISRRKSEIGLRKAMGGTDRHILWQLLGETYCLASISIGLGFLFTSQLFIFNMYNTPVATLVEANLAAFVVILLFCTISAYVPGKLASNLQPAEALHED